MLKAIAFTLGIAALVATPAMAGGSAKQGDTGKSSYVLFNKAKHNGGHNSPAYIHPKKNQFPGDTFHPKKNQFPGDTFHPKAGVPSATPDPQHGNR